VCLFTVGVSSQAPDNTDVHVVLGVLYNVSQDYDGAVECFRKVIRMPLVEPSVFSVEVFTHVLRVSPLQAAALRPDDYSILNKLGATLANSNKSGEALALYRRALDMRPTYARGWLNLGISHANMADYGDAAKVRVLNVVRQGVVMIGGDD
jgi:peroxin-5